MAERSVRDLGAAGEVSAGPLVRLRPRCGDCREHVEWTWRCFCYTDDPQRPAVCRCEEHGLWLCFECGHEVRVLEVSVRG